MRMLVWVMAGLAASTAWANAVPFPLGSATIGSFGELVGNVAGMILHDWLLRIDMRPLAHPGGLVTVETTYHFTNPGAERDCEFVLPVGGDPEVVFDNGPSYSVRHSEPARNGAEPQWKDPPDALPAFEPGQILYNHSMGIRSVARFRIQVKPGPHFLRVNHSSAGAWFATFRPTVCRQVTYLLGPLADWASRRRMRMEVTVPAGWLTAPTPGLVREGNELVGSWTSVPTDAIVLTVRHPGGAAIPLAWIGWVIGFCLCVREGLDSAGRAPKAFRTPWMFGRIAAASRPAEVLVHWILLCGQLSVYFHNPYFIFLECVAGTAAGWLGGHAVCRLTRWIATRRVGSKPARRSA